MTSSPNGASLAGEPHLEKRKLILITLYKATPNIQETHYMINIVNQMKEEVGIGLYSLAQEITFSTGYQ